MPILFVSRNTRKTAAVSSSPPEGSRSSFREWRRAAAPFALLLLTLPLTAQMTVPKLGTVRSADGALHSVQGLPNNLIVSDLAFDPTDAASFSDKGGLVSHQGMIRLLGADLAVIGEYATAEKAPLLNMDSDQTSALAWLPSSQTLVRWDGQQFDAFSLAGIDLEGKVTSLQAVSTKQVRLLVTHADGTVDGITVSTRNGNLVSSEPLIGVRGYAFSQSFFVVYVEGKELVADNLRGYRRTLALPATDLVMEHMSNNWIHLSSASLKQDWALHLTQAEFEISLLPAMSTLTTASREAK